MPVFDEEHIDTEREYGINTRLRILRNEYHDGLDTLVLEHTLVGVWEEHSRKEGVDTRGLCSREIVERFNGPASEVQEKIKDKLYNPGMGMPVRVLERDDLKYFARIARVGPDWHEPDEQDITARLFGDSFDNAGPWAQGQELYYSIIEEHHAVLYYKQYPVIAVNLATLFAWATED